MKLKKDMRVFLDGLFFLALAVVLEGLILYTVFSEKTAFLLLLSQLSVVAIGLYGMGNVVISQHQITVLPEGISVKSLFKQSFLAWAEIAEIGFVDIEWRKPKTQYVYFSRKSLPSRYRERLSASFFSILVSGVFTSLASERLPKELEPFSAYRKLYKQCYSDGTTVHCFQNRTFPDMRASFWLSSTCVELDTGIQFLLTGIVLLGVNDLLRLNSLLIAISYLVLFLYLFFFVRENLKGRG